MAIDYTDLFTHTGKILKYLNVYHAYASTSLPAAELAIDDILSADDNYDLLDGIPQMYEGFQDGAVGWVNQLAGVMQKGFTDKTRVVDQLVGLSSGAGVQTVLRELIRDMNNNSQTVEICAVTIGAVSAESGNVGTAEVFTTKTLDGVSKPRNDAEANPEYRGELSELGVTAETMTLTCISDSYSGGAEGAEVFRWDAGVKGQSYYDWRGEGSGQGPSVVVANGRGILSNGEFEDWTVTDTPDNWTLSTGAVATDTIFQEATNFKRGTYALKIQGKTGVPTIILRQSLTGLIPGKSYFVGAWILGNASVASGTLTIQFNGTGYTPGASEKISLNAAALAALTSYDLQGFFVNIPAVIPSDFNLEIRVSTSLTNLQGIYIDGMVVTETIWHGGIGLAIAAGATPLVKGDRYTFTVANDNAGVFQTFFRKHFKVQLPSDASPSIDDALAT